LRPLVGGATAVLTLQNGLGNEALIAGLVGPEKVMGGLCFVCLNRLEPGIIQHIAHGNIVMGEHERWPEPRTHEIASAFRNAGVACRVAENLEMAHWEKLVWNIPFNGLGVAGSAGYDAVVTGALEGGRDPGPSLTTDRLLADARWTRLAKELMLEVIAAANAKGFKVPESWADKNLERTRNMGLYKASTVLDFEQGRPLELDNLFQE